MRRPWRGWALAGAVLAVALLTVPPAALTRVTVHADAMAPTLRPGERVLVERVTLRWSGPDRGDLVAYRTPAGGLALNRVVALAGDEVALRGTELYVNDRRVAEPYLAPGAGGRGWFGPVIVPAGQVFLLGDNRTVAVDSRGFGGVPVADLVGRVLVRDGPLGRNGRR
ncbi:MAG TPA: signal peptidase I [Pilimelia sp.]|nr:signal peptidase I [Pilimelia sp.]